MNARPYCTCEDVRNISIEAAAERLGCRERLLRENLSRIHHQRYGDKRVFCPCELRLAMRLFTIEPVAKAEPKTDTPAPDLHLISPSRSRRKKHSRTG